eukprot:gene17349-22129_t
MINKAILRSDRLEVHIEITLSDEFVELTKNFTLQ